MNIKYGTSEIYVRDINPSGKQTVILLHGWPLNLNMFDYQYGYLVSEGFRVVAVDLLGFGNSAKPARVTYDFQCDVLHTVIRTLSLNSITLLGYSMGGAIAARYTAKYPERVKKLILLAAALPCFTQKNDFPFGLPQSEVDSLIESINTDKPQAFKTFSDLVFEEENTPEFLTWFSFLTDSTPAYSAIDSLIALKESDLRSDLKKIKVPTAILHGKKDRVCPYSLAEITHSEISGSILVPFDSGHGLFFENQSAVNAVIANFVKGNEIKTLIKENDNPIPNRQNTTFSKNRDDVPFTNPPLPYPYNALEPFIDEKTMHLHHDKHLQAYINNLNNLVVGIDELKGETPESLLFRPYPIPPEIRQAVLDNAGGVYNHIFFFDGLSGKKNMQPLEKTAALIEKSFDSFDAFKNIFKKQALSVFGSGYAWLVLNRDMEAEIITTKNQDTPLNGDYYPLLNLDVWEHSYYLKYQNERGRYVDAFFNVINFDEVERRLVYLYEY